MRDELKPCPFCGETLRINNANLAVHSRESDCLMRQHPVVMDDPKQVERWNTRPAQAEQQPIEIPVGAIENGRAFAERLEMYGFECEGGNILNCLDWQEFRQCFNHLAEWAFTLDVNAAPIAQTAPQGKFRMGDLVKKTSGSEWVGRVVGWYSTEQTPEGYAVESEVHAGSVQIYPAKALEAVE